MCAMCAVCAMCAMIIMGAMSAMSTMGASVECHVQHCPTYYQVFPGLVQEIFR